MNEVQYSFMKDIVLCGGMSVVTLLSLLFHLWYAFLFDGIMLRILAIVEAMTRRLRRCHRNCGPLGLIASTIVGALCCQCLWWWHIGVGYALLDRTALVFLACCGGLAGADLVANAIIAVPGADFAVL